MELPFVTALCPTFRHPTLLQSSLALWLAQDYPLNRRTMVILDDGQTFYNQKGVGYSVWSEDERLPSLPAKYNRMLQLMPEQTEIVLVWEDDDTYLPGYVGWHVNAIRSGCEFSKPSEVYSDYDRSGRNPQTVQREKADGKFHSSMAFTKPLIDRVGGWIETDKKEFDQMLMRELYIQAGCCADPLDFDPKIQYCYGWTTGHGHCQHAMVHNDQWYQKAPEYYAEVPFVGKLIPKYDARTLSILKELNVSPKLEFVNPEHVPTVSSQ